MSNPPTKLWSARRWIAGVVVLMILAPVVAWWAFRPRMATLPIQAFFPTRMSAALRLTDARGVWERHWRRTEGPTPNAALREMLEAAGKWPRWLEKYGRSGAELRLIAYRKAFFNLLGEETWLLFGEWDAVDPPEAGQVGLVLMTRGGSAVKSRAGPLLDLVMENYRFERTDRRGVAFYHYKDDKLGRNVTFCQTDGWICASLRRRKADPLTALVDQAVAWSQSDRRKDEEQNLWGEPESKPRPPSLDLFLDPGRFLGHLRQFNHQRSRMISDDSERKLRYWGQRLEGIERATIRQSGDSLFDLTLDLEGRRPADLAHWIDERTAQTNPMDGAPNETADEPGPIAQIDLALPLAQSLAPLAGHDWETLIEGWDELDFWTRGLRELLVRQLSADTPPPDGRLGLAAYDSTTPLIPTVLFWLDLPPQRHPTVASAHVWATLAEDRPATLTAAQGDCAFWLHPLGSPPLKSPQPEEDLGFEDFANGVWSRPPRPPLGFAAVDFARLAETIERAPTALMKEKIRKRHRRWLGTARALDLATGGAALRLDATGDRLILTLQTP